MKQFRFILLIALLLVGLAPLSATLARADGPAPLKFGEAATGEFTGGAQEIRYSFTAKKLDYIRVVAANVGADPTAPQLAGKMVLLDPAQNQIADGSWQSYGPLPITGFVGTAGVYTLVLTPDTSSSQAAKTGKFEVLAQQASPLEIGKPAQGNVHIDKDYLNYGVAYLVKADTPLRTRFGASSSAETFWLQIGFTPVPAADRFTGFSSVTSLDSKGYLTLDGPYAGEASTVLPASATLYLLTVEGSGASSATPSRDFTLTVEPVKP
jgi:hypothetical protein